MKKEKNSNVKMKKLTDRKNKKKTGMKKGRKKKKNA